MPILEVIDLKKSYDTVKAVDGVSFDIQAGVCFGLLGPNGAGKTTTIEVIEDVIPPTSGRILYKGVPRSASFRNEVGIQFQQTSLLNYLTVRETLDTFRKLYPKGESADKLIDICRLDEFQHRRNDRMSGGQRQRFLLALALINQPELIFLDEPSTGLDPQARQNLWTLIREIKGEGKTIILTTHYMEEAQHLCDEVAIMDQGKIIARGSPKTLIKEHSPGITVILPEDRFAEPPKDFPFSFRRVQGTIEIKTDDANACLDRLMALYIDLSGISVRSPNLETVFLNLTGRHLRE